MALNNKKNMAVFDGIFVFMEESPYKGAGAGEGLRGEGKRPFPFLSTRFPWRDERLSGLIDY